MGPIADRSREHLGAADAALLAARRRLLDSARRLERGVALMAPTSPELYNLRGTACVLPKDVSFDVGAADRIWAPTRAGS
jgi:phthalate 4,5-dioxygenase